MTWTFDDAPDSTTAAGRRDAVRLLIGDTDTNDQLLSDESIAFYLSEANNNIQEAAAEAARAIAGKYSRLADTSFDSVSVSYKNISEAYLSLATRLEKKASKSGSIGSPGVGGISIAAMDAADALTDRPDPAFRRNMFKNPPERDEDYDQYN